MGSKKDILFSIILGEIVGIFLIPTFLHTGIYYKLPLPLVLLLIFLPILSALGMALASFIAKFLAVFKQFAKFIAVGLANTSIDFGILNTLSYFTGITAGVWLVPLNSISFVIAITNSFFWNKFWVFEEREGGATREFGIFLGITLIALAINSAIVVFMTSYFNPFFNLNAAQWENIAKLLATFISLFWNFAGYKFVVFKK